MTRAWGVEGGAQSVWTAGFHSATQTTSGRHANTPPNLSNRTFSQKNEFPNNARDVTVAWTATGVQASNEAPRRDTRGPGREPARARPAGTRLRLPVPGTGRDLKTRGPGGTKGTLCGRRRLRADAGVSGSHRANRPASARPPAPSTCAGSAAPRDGAGAGLQLDRSALSRPRLRTSLPSAFAPHVCACAPSGQPRPRQAWAHWDHTHPSAGAQRRAQPAGPPTRGSAVPSSLSGHICLRFRGCFPAAEPPPSPAHRAGADRGEAAAACFIGGARAQGGDTAALAVRGAGRIAWRLGPVCGRRGPAGWATSGTGQPGPRRRASCCTVVAPAAAR